MGCYTFPPEFSFFCLVNLVLICPDSPVIANHIRTFALEILVSSLPTLVEHWCKTPTVSNNMTKCTAPKALQLSFTLSRSTSSFLLSLVTRSSIWLATLMPLALLIINHLVVSRPCLTILIKNPTLIHQGWKFPNLMETYELLNLWAKSTFKLDTL